MYTKAQITINVVTALFLSLSWIFVSLRCYVRIFIQAHFGLDDAFAIACLAAFSALCAAVFYGTSVAIGKHIFDLTIEKIGEGLKAYFTFELLYVISTCLVKVSFGISLLRIANVRSQIYAIHVVLTVTIIFSVFYLIWILLECHPVSFLWEQFLTDVKGKCRPVHYMVGATYAHGVVMCLGDLSLAILPVVLVSNLHLSRQTKASVAILLALGSIASVATLARIPYVHRLEAIDFFYANNELLIWSIVEVGISIIATAAATLRPLLAKSCFFPLLTQRSTNRYSVNNRYGASRSDGSAFVQGFATSSSTSGGQRHTQSASGWLSQHTRVGSIYEEGQKSIPASSEEQTLDFEIDRAGITVTAIESHLEMGELEQLEVPKCGIQKTVQISQSSLRE